MRYMIVVLGLMIPLHAWAGPSIAVLEFGGDDGLAARSALVEPLSRRYGIIDGETLRAAGPVTRGAALASAAKQVGAVAVIAGAMSDGKLSLAVFSGATGEVVNTARIRAPRGLRGQALRSALRVILIGLRQCPARMEPEPEPVPEPGPVPVPADPVPADPVPADPVPAPVPADSSPDLAYDPTAAPTPTPVSPGADQEDPLARIKGSQIPVDAATSPAATVTAKAEPSGHGAPRLQAAVGFGVWSRSFAMHKPDDDYFPDQPTYHSGAAAALAIALKARPLAFLKDQGFLAGLYARAHYRTALGLKSAHQYRDSGGAPQTEMLGTSLWEMCLEAGYDWNLLGRPTSPRLELGLGYGMMNFALDKGSTVLNLPAAAYRFLLLGAGFELPVASWIGAHTRFDYRVVSGTGEIEEDAWYGPSSTGGINLALGLSGSYKGFVLGVEYSYTRYFYAFENDEQRAEDCRTGASTCLRAAGGALDILHGVTASVGYGF